jgi:hypothetical protein
VARSITDRGVIGVLREQFILRGAPAHIRSGNGPEFGATAVPDWLDVNQVGLLSPCQNAVRVPFTCKLKDECMHMEFFGSLAQARS